MDVQSLLFGDQDFTFLGEVALRTAVMFILMIVFMNFTGKRSISQMSVFEMVMIIALGSAAGDPMFYKDVGLLVAFAVLAVTIFIYRCIIYLVTHSERWEMFFEGQPEYMIQDGRFTDSFLKKKKLGIDEFFSEMRKQNIEHTGQVHDVMLETNGAISVIFKNDDEVGWGMPIWPEKFQDICTNPAPDKYYSCRKCGETKPGREFAKQCKRCHNAELVESINKIRIS